MGTRKIASPTLCGALALFAFLPSITSAQSVGSAAAVKPTSTGTPPGGSARTLEIGTDIVSRERIETSGSGSLQVMFLDKTTLTVGPGSDLVIDEFVYNPAAGGGGQFAATLARGALRFVGGQISHNQGATINTPSATIGIRGGGALIEILRDCNTREQMQGLCTRVACTAGLCTVNSRVGDAGSIQLRVGQAVEIGSLGASDAFNVSSLRLNSVTGAGGGDVELQEGELTQTENNDPALLSQRVDQEIPQQQAEPPPPPPPNNPPPPPPPPPPP